MSSCEVTATWGDSDEIILQIDNEEPQIILHQLQSICLLEELAKLWEYELESMPTEVIGTIRRMNEFILSLPNVTDEMTWDVGTINQWLDKKVKQDNPTTAP